MQEGKSKIEARYKELSEKMAASCGIKPQDLSKAQQTVIFIHAANLEQGL